MTKEEVDQLYIKTIYLIIERWEEILSLDEDMEEVEMPQYIGRTMNELKEELEIKLTMILMEDKPEYVSGVVIEKDGLLYLNFLNDVCIDSCKYISKGLKKIKDEKQSEILNELERIFVYLIERAMDPEFILELCVLWDEDQRKKYMEIQEYILLGDWEFRKHYQKEEIEKLHKRLFN